MAQLLPGARFPEEPVDPPVDDDGKLRRIQRKAQPECVGVHGLPDLG